mmetsp:Transcript_112019/g.167701  ORF Transcript_112019/g.167701 Transcript_112019/m.167701 type:complete len:270 (+) Transcript_112019:671-1480(+)
MEFANRAVVTFGTLTSFMGFIQTLSAVCAKEMSIVIRLLVAEGRRLGLTELSSERRLLSGRVLTVTSKADIVVCISRLHAFGTIEAVKVSTTLSLYLALGTELAFWAVAVLKIPVVLPPELVVHGRVIVLDAQLTRTAIAVQRTIGNLPQEEFAVGSAVPIRTVARMRPRFKVVDAGASVRAKDFSISTLLGAHVFAVLSYVRKTIVVRFSAVAIQVLGSNFVFNAFDTLATVIAIVAGVSAFFEFTATSKSHEAVRTITVPSLPAGFS